MKSQNVERSPIKFRYFFCCDVLALNIMHAYQIEYCVWPKSPGTMLTLASVTIDNILTNCYPHGCVVQRNAEDCQQRHFRPRRVVPFPIWTHLTKEISAEKLETLLFVKLWLSPIFPVSLRFEEKKIIWINQLENCDPCDDRKAVTCQFVLHNHFITCRVIARTPSRIIFAEFIHANKRQFGKRDKTSAAEVSQKWTGKL